MPTSTHTGFIRTSDFLLMTVLLAGGILEYYFPSSLQEIVNGSGYIIGLLLLILGWLLIFFSKYELKRFAQSSRPGIPTEVLVTSGPFKFSRNPIYVGILFICMALGFLSNSAWILSMTLPLSILITYVLIIPEEHYLILKFKDEFLKYKENVRRWI